MLKKLLVATVISSVALPALAKDFNADVYFRQLPKDRWYKTAEGIYQDKHGHDLGRGQIYKGTKTNPKPAFTVGSDGSNIYNEAQKYKEFAEILGYKNVKVKGYGDTVFIYTGHARRIAELEGVTKIPLTDFYVKLSAAKGKTTVEDLWYKAILGYVGVKS